MTIELDPETNNKVAAAEMENQSAAAADTIPGQQQAKRLIMDQMVLENFKSYAGRIIIGPFQKVSTTPFTTSPSNP
jgi:hypothetical protein